MGQPAAQQRLRRGNDLRHAGLVVRAQQRGPVRDHQGFAFQRVQMGKTRRGQHAPAAAQGDVPAVVVFDKRGTDALAGKVGDGVEVGKETDTGLFLIARRGGYFSVDVAVLVHIHVLYAHLPQFPLQHPRQIKLPRRGRRPLRLLRAGGGYLHIVDEPFVCPHVVASVVLILIHFYYSRFLRFCKRAGKDWTAQ